MYVYCVTKLAHIYENEYMMTCVNNLNNDENCWKKCTYIHKKRRNIFNSAV